MMQSIENFITGGQWELLVFAGLAVLTLVSALFVVTARRVTHACLSLLPCFVGIAGLYAVLGSAIMLAFQLLIYAGGIMVLMLFAIVLLDRRTGPIVAQHHIVLPGLLISGLIGLILLASIRQTGPDFQSPNARLDVPVVEITGHEKGSDWYAYTVELDEETGQPRPYEMKESNVRRTGFYFLTYYVLPFELTSLILVVAMVGAIIMARREKGWVAAGKILGPSGNDDDDEPADAEGEEESA